MHHRSIEGAIDTAAMTRREDFTVSHPSIGAAITNSIFRDNQLDEFPITGVSGRRASGLMSNWWLSSECHDTSTAVIYSSGRWFNFGQQKAKILILKYLQSAMHAYLIFSWMIYSPSKPWNQSRINSLALFTYCILYIQALNVVKYRMQHLSYFAICKTSSLNFLLEGITLQWAFVTKVKKKTKYRMLINSTTIKINNRLRYKEKSGVGVEESSVISNLVQ